MYIMYTEKNLLSNSSFVNKKFIFEKIYPINISSI